MLLLPTLLGATALAFVFGLQRELHGPPTLARIRTARRTLRVGLSLALLAGACWLAFQWWPGLGPAFTLAMVLGMATPHLHHLAERRGVPKVVPHLWNAAALCAVLALLGPYPWPDRSLGGLVVGAGAAGLLALLLAFAYEAVEPEWTRRSVHAKAIIALVVTAAAWAAWWPIGLLAGVLMTLGGLFAILIFGPGK